MDPTDRTRALEREVADHLRHEQDLATQLEHYRTIVELAPIGLVQVDPQTGRYTAFNQHFLDLFGYSADEMLRLRIWDVTHPDDREQDWQRFSAAVRGEVPEHVAEKRYVRKDGTVFWGWVRVRIVYDDMGKPIRTVAVCDALPARQPPPE